MEFQLIEAVVNAAEGGLIKIAPQQFFNRQPNRGHPGLVNDFIVASPRPQSSLIQVQDQSSLLVKGKALFLDPCQKVGHGLPAIRQHQRAFNF